MCKRWAAQEIEDSPKRIRRERKDIREEVPRRGEI
jgi:hypothetical protein